MRLFKGLVPAAGQPASTGDSLVRRLALTLWLLLLGALLSSRLPAQAQAGQPGPSLRVSGTVSDARTGRPLPGAAIGCIRRTAW